MKKFLLLIIYGIASVPAFGQNTIGLPEIINYSKQRYAAGTQNWDIKKDKNGIVYFGNNEGLLSFDGTYWKLQALPNKSIVRSVEIGNDGKIYVGGQEELGFFYPDKQGCLVYTSLKPLIPKDESSFADVWDVIIFENQVFFRSNRKIFQYVHNQITVFKSIDWRFMGLSNGELIAQEYERGLLKFQNGVWTPFLKNNILPADYRVSTIISITKDSTLLATQNNIYLLHKDVITPFEPGALHNVAADILYASAKLGEDRIALATTLGGCYIVDKKGNLIQRLAKEDGIQLNNILSVYADNEKNLWLGLDNGIDFINYGSALKKISPDPMNKYSGYACIIYNNELYLGTSAGAFRAKLYESNDLSFVKSGFEEIKNTKGQVWNFSNINGQLLMGHTGGAFLIKDNAAIPLDPSSGFWTFQPLNNVLPSSRMIAGTYNGINIYDYNGSKFIKSSLHAHFESARFVVNDNGVLWIAHPYKGLYIVTFDSTGAPTASVYNDKKGILSANDNYLFRIHNKTILCTEKGIFELDAAKKDFIPSTWYNSLFGKQPISYLTEDHYGNIWFVADRRIGIIEETDTKPEIHYFTELDNKILANHAFINAVDSSNIFIAADDGFYHLNYAAYKKEKHPVNVLIRNIKAVNKVDSLVYGGYRAGDMQKNETHKISSAWNSFRFEYAAPVYSTDNIEYSYFLKGFDKTWSEWNKKTDKEYTNLPPNQYIFQVKARYNKEESAIASYSFTILPAWYETVWAKAMYIIILLVAAYIVYKQYRKKLLLQQLKHEEEQKRLQYLHQLEIDKTEKEIVKLKNENLEAEIQYKNTELASSAMHLVQKGELLTKIKDELIKLKKHNGNEKLMEEFKKIVRILSDEEKMDEEWEQFAQHFDKVHTDFLLGLKKDYPALSSNELKLCAYLRMNLSTKEIAQLMNISVRGVEISRYRLRKKLQLQTSDNLFGFLLKLDSKAGAEKTNGTMSSHKKIADPN